MTGAIHLRALPPVITHATAHATASAPLEVELLAALVEELATLLEELPMLPRVTLLMLLIKRVIPTVVDGTLVIIAENPACQYGKGGQEVSGTGIVQTTADTCHFCLTAPGFTLGNASTMQ
jgi:hypothetical protein